MGGLFSSPKAPKAPNPNKLAKKQAKLNQKAAQQSADLNAQTAAKQQDLNMVNQVTPEGSLTYSKDPTSGAYTATTTLTPAAQATQDASQQLDLNATNTANEQLGRASDALSTPFEVPANDLGTFTLPENTQQPLDLPAWDATTFNPDTPDMGTFNPDTSAIEGRLTDLGRQRLDPLVAQRRAALETKLMNQGVQPGTEAWNRAVTENDQQTTDAYNQLFLTGNQQAYNELLGTRQQQTSEAGQKYSQAQSTRQQQMADRQQQITEQLQSRTLSDQERQQLVNEQLALRQQQEKDRAQGIAEQLTQRNQPLNELSALLGLQQVQQPNWLNTPQTSINQSQIGSPDYMGAAQNNYLGALNQYSTQTGANNALYGALGGLAGGALGGWGQSGFALK